MDNADAFWHGRQLGFARLNSITCCPPVFQSIDLTAIVSSPAQPRPAVENMKELENGRLLTHSQGRTPLRG